MRFRANSRLSEPLISGHSATVGIGSIGPSSTGRPAQPPPPADVAAVGDEIDEDAPLSNRWRIFAVVSVGLFMVSLDQTIVSTALQTLHQDLHTTVNWAGWTITGYQLGMAAMMPLLGRISDQFGRKRVFIACTVLFITSSLACGLAQNIEMLIPFRVIQAAGGGGFVPSATGIISDSFKRERERPIALFTSILPFGGLVGPVLGGLIIRYWSWRGVFFINVPIGIVLIVLLVRMIPRTAPKGHQSIDFIGAFELASTLTGIMLALSELGERSNGPTSLPVLVPFLAAVGLGTLFVRHLRHTESPIVPVALLARREFAVMNAINTIFGVVGLGIGALVPLYAEERYHISALNSGTLLSARGLAVMLCSTAAAYLIRRTGYKKPMIVGFTFIGIGVVLIWLTPPFTSPYLWLALAAGVAGIGIGMSLPSTNNASLSLAPDDIAAAAGLRGTCRQFGAIIGISIATAITARSTHPGIALSHVYLYFALLIIPLYVLTAFISDRQRGGGW